MVKETHVKGGYVISLLTLPFINNQLLNQYNIFYKFTLLLLYIYFAYLGSLFPDIDMRGSYISKRYPIIYKLFGSKFRHRSFTHSLIFLFVLFNISEFVVKYTDNNIAFITISISFIIGYSSHILLDLITKEGIELLYPIKINFSILPIKTNSKIEKFICKALNFIVIFLLGFRFYELI